MTQWSHNAVPDILTSHRGWEQLLTVVFSEQKIALQQQVPDVDSSLVRGDSWNLVWGAPLLYNEHRHRNRYRFRHRHGHKHSH